MTFAASGESLPTVSSIACVSMSRSTSFAAETARSGCSQASSFSTDDRMPSAARQNMLKRYHFA